MTLFPGPSRAPLPRDLDWRDQSWRSRIGGRGMVGGLYPGYGFRDFAGGRYVSSDGIHNLPSVTPSPDLGIAWDFSGSRTATMGNWGNEYWSGTTAQFSITLIIDRFYTGTSCIIAKADDVNGLMWEIFDISTSGNMGRLAWYVRGAGGAYLEMITDTPPAGVVHTDKPNVITVIANLVLSGSSRMRVYINGVDVSTSVSDSGDMSGGIANNASEIIIGYWNPTNQYYWPGKLGGVWFHDHAISALEIQILHGQTTRYSFLPVHEDDWVYGVGGSSPPHSKFYFRRRVGIWPS